MNPDLVTIVTGGGRGIGRTIARRMAAETAVIIVGRTRRDLQSTVGEICHAGGQAAYVQGDVADSDTAKRTVEKAAKKGWTIRNLVCNAGIGKGGPTETFDEETFRRMFDVNVFGAFSFMKACLPKMIAQKSGHICLISSILGVKPYKFDAPYCGTKAALNAMAQSVAQEHAKNGIVVVPICPDFTESEMTDKVIRNRAQRKNITLEQATSEISASLPQNRIIPAEEVAEAVAFVCSGKCKAMTRHPLVLGGGN